MAASDSDGFGFPGIPGLIGGENLNEPDGLEDLIIPDIYQRIIVQQRDYVQEADEDSQEEDPEDYNLTAPPLES